MVAAWNEAQAFVLTAKKVIEMAALSIQEEIALAKENGATEVVDNKFGVNVRNMDAGDPLVKDDIITIPKDYKVLKAKINQDSEDEYPFIVANVKNPATGAEKNIRLFPNMLAKTAFPIENGKRLPKVKTTGSAAVAYAECKTADEAFEKWTANHTKDCQIQVKADTEVTIHDRFTDKDRQTHIYQYDLL